MRNVPPGIQIMFGGACSARAIDTVTTSTQLHALFDAFSRCRRLVSSRHIEFCRKTQTIASAGKTRRKMTISRDKKFCAPHSDRFISCRRVTISFASLSATLCACKSDGMTRLCSQRAC